MNYELLLNQLELFLHKQGNVEALSFLEEISADYLDAMEELYTKQRSGDIL